MPWTKLIADTDRLTMKHADQGNRLLSFREALLEAQAQAMAQDPRVFVLGEGVDDPAGSFGTTLGLKERFGAMRVLDLPLAENGGAGIAMGAALAGQRPILVHLRADFLLLSMDQIVNHAAKWRYMFNAAQTVPLVIRAVIGRGWGSAAQHSQSLQGLFCQVPGLKVVMPATPYDAKGLLLAALAHDGPALFFEHRWLYEVREPVPENACTVSLGKALVRRRGRHATVAAASFMVLEALKAAQELADEAIDVEVIDLRTVKPWDLETVLQSVEKTGRLVVADTGNLCGGLTAEIAAVVQEKAFQRLKAPIRRIGLPDIPCPASAVLEAAFYPGAEDIKAAIRRMLLY